MDWPPPELSQRIRERALVALEDPDAPKTMPAEVFLERIIGPHLIDLAEQFDGLRPMPDYPNRRLYQEQLTEANGSISMVAEARNLDQEIDVIAIRIVWKFEG